MWLRLQRVLPLLFCIVLVEGLAAGLLHIASADNAAANWFTSDAPALTKLSDLPHDTSPVDNGGSCSSYSYTPKGATKPTTVCVFGSTIGNMAADGTIQTGSDSFVRITGDTSSLSFIPSPAGNVAIVPTAQNGVEIGLYQGLSMQDLQYHAVQNGAPYYTVPIANRVNFALSSNTHAPIHVYLHGIAFSPNGEWMAAAMPFIGLVRVHLPDLAVMQFAGPIEPGGYTGTNTNVPLAISDDGRYVAANTDVYYTSDLAVYDLSTCTDQTGKAASQAHYCSSRDIWYNQSGRKGILSIDSTMWLPSHLQFVDDGSLSFYARYGSQGSDYKVASFVAMAPGGTPHGIGLLGMGDSYISGQGAYLYRANSDTTNDTCHVSELAYPFTLGKKYFSSYNSIACSGATTVDISGPAAKYTGQVKGGVDESVMSEPQKEGIITSFLPGYIHQQKFAKAYKPAAILVSVGGDDIQFSKIVKQCASGGTCYETYEDRAELVGEINATYNSLKTTYTTLRQQSNGARVYVVGYPQVALPGGNCGANVRLNSSEVTFASQLTAYLDSVIQRAAQDAGVFYVDTQNAFDGHRLCESDAAAMNGLTYGNDSGITVPKVGTHINVVASESFHPTQLGYQLLADTIAAKTSNLTSSMPTPTNYGIPVFDPTLPLLAVAPITGRPINWVKHDDSIFGDVMLPGDAQQVTVNGSEVQLQPGSSYQIVLHSTPVQLAKGQVQSDGTINANMQVPADTELGYHTVHVYGTSMAGEPVDIQKIIYVANVVDDGNPTAPTMPTNTVQSNNSENSGGPKEQAVPNAPSQTAAAPVLTPSQEASAIQPAGTVGDALPDSSSFGVAGSLDHAVLGDSTVKRKIATPTYNIASTGAYRSTTGLQRVFWLAGLFLLITVAGLKYWRVRS